jgi:hypothetical protein
VCVCACVCLCARARVGVCVFDMPQCRCSSCARPLACACALAEVFARGSLSSQCGRRHGAGETAADTRRLRQAVTAEQPTSVVRGRRCGRRALATPVMPVMPIMPIMPTITIVPMPAGPLDAPHVADRAARDRRAVRAWRRSSNMTARPRRISFRTVVPIVFVPLCFGLSVPFFSGLSVPLFFGLSVPLFSGLSVRLCFGSSVPFFSPDYPYPYSLDYPYRYARLGDIVVALATFHLPSFWLKFAADAKRLVCVRLWPIIRTLILRITRALILRSIRTPIFRSIRTLIPRMIHTGCFR